MRATSSVLSRIIVGAVMSRCAGWATVVEAQTPDRPDRRAVTVPRCVSNTATDSSAPSLVIVSWYGGFHESDPQGDLPHLNDDWYGSEARDTVTIVAPLKSDAIDSLVVYAWMARTGIGIDSLPFPVAIESTAQWFRVPRALWSRIDRAPSTVRAWLTIGAGPDTLPFPVPIDSIGTLSRHGHLSRWRYVARLDVSQVIGWAESRVPLNIAAVFWRRGRCSSRSFRILIPA